MSGLYQRIGLATERAGEYEYRAMPYELKRDNRLTGISRGLRADICVLDLDFFNSREGVEKVAEMKSDLFFALAVAFGLVLMVTIVLLIKILVEG